MARLLISRALAAYIPFFAIIYQSSRQAKADTLTETRLRAGGEWQDKRLNIFALKWRRVYFTFGR